MSSSSVAPVSSGSAATSASSSALSAQDLASGTDFFKILTAQLQAQDPLQPMDNEQFLQQLTQQNQLEQSLQTNQKLDNLASLQQSLAALQQMTQSASLIGKSVDYLDATTGDAKRGTVQGVRVDQGLVVLDVDGSHVALPQVTAITQES
jgi:flagellar basal-body rod modification protein FlgD